MTEAAGRGIERHWFVFNHSLSNWLVNVENWLVNVENWLVNVERVEVPRNEKA